MKILTSVIILIADEQLSAFSVGFSKTTKATQKRYTNIKQIQRERHKI